MKCRLAHWAFHYMNCQTGAGAGGGTPELGLPIAREQVFPERLRGLCFFPNHG